MKKYFLFVLVVLVSTCFSVYADNYNRDTLWMKKTDQGKGFYMLKFSQNDSIIAGFGYEKTMFYDAKTGNEINRIDGNYNGFFIKNDSQFIKLRSNGSKIDIYDLKSFKIVDSLESDGLDIYDNSDISNDNRFYISTVSGGLRVWDLESKKIIRTKIYDVSNEKDLISWGFGKLKYNLCNQNQIITPKSKTYNIPNSSPPKTRTVSSLSIIEFITLDSINELYNNGQFFLSKNCKYNAYITHDNNYGIEIYDYQKKQLLYKLPVNGLNVTGLEFTSDEKFLVTSSGPDDNSLIVWEIGTGKIFYSYGNTSFDNFNISHSNKLLTFSVGNSLKMLKTRFDNSSVIDIPNTSNPIYPNPTNGFVTININCLLPQIQYSIVNSLGQILATSITQNINNKIQLNFSQYPSGVYYIGLHCNQDITNYKIIKE